MRENVARKGVFGSAVIVGCFGLGGLLTATYAQWGPGGNYFMQIACEKVISAIANNSSAALALAEECAASVANGGTVLTVSTITGAVFIGISAALGGMGLFCCNGKNANPTEQTPLMSSSDIQVHTPGL